MNPVEYCSTMHCKKCDSQNLRQTSLSGKWDFEIQEWVYTDIPEGRMYYCLDCYTDDSDCVEKDVVGCHENER
jgi:hypothetical protein